MTKNRVVSTVALLLIAVTAFALFAGCNNDVLGDLPETTDNYRTMYQIFPIAFADSDGNGKGDIQGIIDKLDYIADMNFDGIWLTPVHESTTYHKYDVVDYKSIDDDFGTLEDYDRLVQACHERGMTIIMDLVINHTSSKSQWFIDACNAHLRNRPDNQYYNYYNFSQTQYGSTWYSVGNGWYYEGQFWSEMPDLNWAEVLENPDGYLAKDLEEVMRYWLVDHDVDGFRLDAVGEFFSGNDTRNIECLKWINDTAKAIKPDCYIVGEGPWGANAYKYHESGIDSFFLFTHGYRTDNSIAMAARGMPGAFGWFADIDRTDASRVGCYEGSIPALFISNHDTARALGILQGNISVDNMKMGYAVMAMCCGTTYVYYGDEVGMSSYDTSRDENKRQPMPWEDEYLCKPVKGSTSAEDTVKYPFGTVEQNLKDKDSLIAFITRANAVRRAFPAIARDYGKILYEDEQNDGLGIIQKGEGEDAVYIVANLSHVYGSTLDLSQFGKFELLATLNVNGAPKLKGNSISMPAMSFAVLRKV